VYVVSFIYYIKHTLYTMARISLNIDERILQQFDSMWKAEGWESRQEAIVFLMKQALARGFISKEKSELAKVIEKGVKGTESLALQGGDG